MTEHVQSVEPPVSSLLRTPSGVTTACIELSAANFGLETLFDSFSDVEVHIEPTIANPTDHALLVVQTSESDQERIEAVLQTDPAVAMVEAFRGFGDEFRFRITWDEPTRTLINEIVVEGATIVAAHGQSSRWELRLVTPEHSTVPQVHDILEERDCESEVLSIRTTDDYRPNSSGMSKAQQEALVTAFEMGYYEIPRTASLTEVAVELGISHQALSERVRRAHEQLVEANHISPGYQEW